MGPPPPPKAVHVFHEKEEEEDTLKEDIDVQVADIDAVQPDMSRGLCVAANNKKRWTDEEEKLVNISLKRAESYKKYLEECRDKMIPARTKTAFICKYDKMKAGE